MIATGASIASPSEPVKTVVICDTEPVAVEGLRALLPASEMRIAAAESTLPAGLDAVHDLRPSLFIIDKAFGFHSVLDAIRGVGASAPDTRVVVWSSVLTDSEALRVMHAGATGVIRKTMPLEAVLQCLESAAKGAPWMDGVALHMPGPAVRARDRRAKKDAHRPHGDGRFNN